MEVIWPPWKKIINDHFLPLNNNHDRYLILYGGRGSSKTDYIAKRLIARCIDDDYFRFILIRNNYNSIKDSQFQTIKDIVYEMGLDDIFEFKMQPFEIICNVNGNKFIARGCDDTTKLKSVKDPTGAWYEEDVPSEDDFITITTSIRTQKADYLQEIFTINPEVEGNYEDNWFWKRFFKGQPEKSFNGKTSIEIGKELVDVTYTAHHSTYHDNRWLPIEFKAFLEDLKRTNPYYFTIYTLGEWGNKISGGRFYRSFDRARHLTPQRYNSHLPLHISFDFNVRPYMSLSIWQVEGKKAVQVDEIAAKEPLNHTAGICREFVKKFTGHRAGVFIYGDPAGFHEDTRQNEKGHNDYFIIMAELKQFNPQSRVARSAPPIVSRGNFINQIFEINQGGVTILINENCSYSIMDLVYLKENPDGTKFKEKGKDDTGGVSEKYGHFCFVGETLITTSGGQKRIDQISIGDWVMTRKGFKQVLQVHNNGLKPVKQFLIGGKIITCTLDHKIWTKEHEFIPIRFLNGWITFCIFDETLKIWKEKRLFIQGKNSIAIPIRSTEAKGFITQGILKSMVSLKKLDFMFTNMFAKLVKFQRVLLSIILTEILSIMKFLIMNLKLEVITSGFTWNQRTEKINQEFHLINQDGKPYYGINLMREENNIQKIRLKAKSLLKSFVQNAEKKQNVLLWEIENLPTISRNIAVENAKIGAHREKLEQRIVYDITVDGCHEYFANGILVHNSDGLDYFITEIFRNEFNAYLSGGISGGYESGSDRDYVFERD